MGLADHSTSTDPAKREGARAQLQRVVDRNYCTIQTIPAKHSTNQFSF